jgi:Hairy Orange/Helix-loop-helix DNA-binding domain
LCVSQQSGSRPTKLEKADILEMTVRHVRRLQCAARTSTPTGGASEKFKTGFAECVSEVHSGLGRIENVDPQLKERLGSHLGSCLSEIRPSAASTPVTVAAEEPSAVVSSSSPSPPPTPLFAHKEGFTLVPTKLPNGDLAFVIPAEMQVLRQSGGTNKLVLKSQIMENSEPLWRPW